MAIIQRIFLLVLMGWLSACASNTDPVFKSVRNVMNLLETEEPQATNPNFQYIRVVIDRNVAILALGAYDNDGTEVWVSGDKVVLRLRNGRLAGALGLSTEWQRVVQNNAPAWTEVIKADAPVTWTRVRDVMPGYQVGIRDELSWHRIDPPKESGILNVAPDALIWFEETEVSGRLPVARYAVNMDTKVVVYGEQCLSSVQCLHWQRWAATPPAK